MKGHVVVCLLLASLALAAAGLSLGADKPKDGEKDSPKEPLYFYYAKVEVKGVLITPIDSNELFSIVNPRRPNPTTIPLSVSKLKMWTKKQLEKCNGRVVLVTGPLELVPVETKPGVTEDRLAVVAETLEFVEKDVPLPKDP